ncbi:MAG: hypothetical protein ACYS74_21290, partial [Planctomycetota bacterium]
DRRFIFEEAAGISKYKAHKKEALRKLERTEQNLLRLADILGEVAKRLRSVKLQAGKARNYLEYTGRLKELQVNYSLVEYAKNQTQLTEKQEGLARVSEQFEGLEAEVSREDTLLSRLGEEIIETEHKLTGTGNGLVSVQSKIEQQIQRIDFLDSAHRLFADESFGAWSAKRIRGRENRDAARADERFQGKLRPLEQRVRTLRKDA